MKITAKEEYGLRCLLQVARGVEGHPVTVGHVAEGEGMTLQYAAKMMHMLRKANLIRSYRGVKGGFVLAKPAATISLWEVMERLSGGSYDDQFCGKYRGTQDACVHLGNCGVRSVWSTVVSHLQRVLSHVTVAELLKDERETNYSMAAHFQKDGQDLARSQPVMFIGGR